MKLIKTRLRSSLTGKNLSNLMKIATEVPDELTDNRCMEQKQQKNISLSYFS